MAPVPISNDEGNQRSWTPDEPEVIIANIKTKTPKDIKITCDPLNKGKVAVKSGQFAGVRQPAGLINLEIELKDGNDENSLTYVRGVDMRGVDVDKTYSSLAQREPLGAPFTSADLLFRFTLAHRDGDGDGIDDFLDVDFVGGADENNNGIVDTLDGGNGLDLSGAPFDILEYYYQGQFYPRRGRIGWHLNVGGRVANWRNDQGMSYIKTNNSKDSIAVRGLLGALEVSGKKGSITMDFKKYNIFYLSGKVEEGLITDEAVGDEKRRLQGE